MDAIIEALAEQQGEMADLLDGLSESGWHAPTRCEGWDVSDVVLHVAQSNELALGSASGRFAEVSEELTRGLGPALSVDDGAAMMVEGQRGMPSDQLLERWTVGAAGLVNALSSMDLSTRVSWVAGDLSARTLATTRLAETWIHSGDIAEALDVELIPTDRLRLISRLAWRTLPYAFSSAGRTMTGPVAFQLVSPSGEAWDFLPDEAAVTTIRGSAVELCAVAARRADPSSTSLTGEGPDVADVLALVRTYA